MRRIFKTAMSAVLTLAMVASVAVGYAPKAEAAENLVELTPWTFFQTGTTTDYWNGWEICAWDGVTTSTGEVLTKAQFPYGPAGETIPEGPQRDQAVNNKLYGSDATVSTTSPADGFTAGIESNGWSASWVGTTLAGDNPYTLRTWMENIPLKYGHKYVFSFKFNATSQKRFSVTLKGGDNQLDFDEYVYNGTDEIAHTYEFTYEEGQNPNDPKGKASVIFQFGAWMYSAPQESNWSGSITISGFKFVDLGLDPAYEKYSVKFVDNGKEVSRPSVQKGEKVQPLEIKKAGYKLDGWYAGSTKFDFAKTPITKDITLTAKWVKVKAPKKAVIKSAKSNAHKRITVKVKKASGIDGYVIQVARNKKFTKGLKEVESSKIKTTIKKLKAGKKYYVRVKAYKLDSMGNKIMSKKWSKKKARWIS